MISFWCGLSWYGWWRRKRVSSTYTRLDSTWIFLMISHIWMAEKYFKMMSLFLNMAMTIATLATASSTLWEGNVARIASVIAHPLMILDSLIVVNADIFNVLFYLIRAYCCLRFPKSRLATLLIFGRVNSSIHGLKSPGVISTLWISRSNNRQRLHQISAYIFLPLGASSLIVLFHQQFFGFNKYVRFLLSFVRCQLWYIDHNGFLRLVLYLSGYLLVENRFLFILKRC